MTEVRSPGCGRVRPLSAAPDPVFAAELVGAGILIDPAGTPAGTVEARAPLAGTVVKAHPHAFVVASPDGVGVLVHLGIDTVGLKGEGFEMLVAERATVQAGQPMVRWDPSSVRDRGLSPVVMVCVLDSAPGSVTSIRLDEDVTAGEALFTWP